MSETTNCDNIFITSPKISSPKQPIRIDNMIIASKTKPEVLLADMSWWTMIKNSPPEIYQNYKLLCPTIFYAENYHDIKAANKRFKTPYEVIGVLPWQLLAKNQDFVVHLSTYPIKMTILRNMIWA